MTTLAAGALRGEVTRGDALIVRILIKIQPNVRMAGPADITANEIRIARRLRTHYYRRREQTQKDSPHLFNIVDGSGNTWKKLAGIPAAGRGPATL